MLTGKELGGALKAAMKLKKVTQAQVAAEFGIKQPSVSEWTRFGRISKEHLNHLVAYFSDVVGPEHWGLDMGAPRLQALFSNDVVLHDDGPRGPLAIRDDDPRGPYWVRDDGRKIFIDEESAAMEGLAPAFTPHRVVVRHNSAGKTVMLSSLTRLAELAKSTYDPPRRRLLAQMVASMFEDGPTETTASAIDAYTKELDKPAEKLAIYVEGDSEVALLRAFREQFHALGDALITKLTPKDRELFNDFAAAVEAEARRSVNATVAGSGKAVHDKRTL